MPKTDEEILDPEAESEEEEVFEEDEEETEGEESPDSEAAHATSKKDRPRDVFYRELTKRDKKISELEETISHGFGKLEGILAARSVGDSGEEAPTGEPELSDDQMSELIQQGRGAEVYAYVARREARQIARQENERAFQKLRNEQARASTVQSLHADFPELKNEGSPLARKADMYFSSEAGQYGGVEAVKKNPPLHFALARAAAERAARLHPDLRDESMRRDKKTRSASETAAATNGGLDTSRRPRKKDGDLPVLTKTDQSLGDFYGADLKNPEVAKKIRQFKKEAADRRHTLRSSEED